MAPMRGQNLLKREASPGLLSPAPYALPVSYAVPVQLLSLRDISGTWNRWSVRAEPPVRCIEAGMFGVDVTRGDVGRKG